MAHAKIYQLSKKPIKRIDYVEPDDFYDNSNSYADYIGEAVEDKSVREECVSYLARKLKDIFDRDGDTLVYKGSDAMKVFKQKWADFIHEKAQEITADNVMQNVVRSTLRLAVNDTHLDFEGRLCIEEWSGKFAEPMAALISFVCSEMKKGQRLYIGALIDFHY